MTPEDEKFLEDAEQSALDNLPAVFMRLVGAIKTNDHEAAQAAVTFLREMCEAAIENDPVTFDDAIQAFIADCEDFDSTPQLLLFDYRGGDLH